MWDSAKNRSSVIRNLPFFDHALSFDPDSAKLHDMVFRPLFFARGGEETDRVEPDITISFVGTVHTDRYAVLKAIAQSVSPDLTRFWYLYLQAPWIFDLLKLTRPDFKAARIEEFAFEPMPRDQVQSIYQRSRCIVDIEHPQQTGLTMRLIEAFGAGKKLLTTNKNVADYDLYDPENIRIIDRRKTKAPDDFLRSAYKPVSEALRHKYSLAGWVDEVLAPLDRSR